ncbi:MAG: hypothetical protein INF79_00925 [Roseomonas sp.]|nr:hypothetical protein [Roseomonas sp.]
MLTGAAPVMKAAPQGAVGALALGREVASRNQKRTVYPSGKYDFFGCTQLSFGRWLKRGLRGSCVVLMMLILPACASISEEDNVLFRNLHDLARSTRSSSVDAPTPQSTSHCEATMVHDLIEYMNFSECAIAIMEHYLPTGMTQELSRAGQFADPENYLVVAGGGRLDGEGDAMAKFTRFQQFTNANCPRSIPVPGTIECVRPFRTSLRDLRGCMFCFSQPTGPCRQGVIRFSIGIPNAQDLRVKQVRFDSIQPCS